MIIREVREEERGQFNKIAVHPLQAWEWGEFRKSLGSEVVRLGVFEGGSLVSGYQLYSTRFPKTKKGVWLMLRGPMPDAPMLESIRKLGRERDGIFVKLEPNVGGICGETTKKGQKGVGEFLLENGCVVGKPFFATHTFWVDLTKKSEELFSKMKEKTRYNVRLAQKHGVEVIERSDEAGFETYLDMMFGTAKRQGFKAHNRDYHKKMWAVLNKASSLRAHLLTANYKGKTLSSWMLFEFNDVLYYPYGASSEEYREVMANYAMMWGAIELGKKIGCRRFDLWGAAEPGYSQKDPWAGFTKFKEGFGGDWIEYVGSFNLKLEDMGFCRFSHIN